MSTKQRPQSSGTGCCGGIILLIILLVAVVVIGGLIIGDDKSDLSIDQGTGTLTVKVTPVDSPDSLGASVTQRVYEVAAQHHELTTLVIELEFYPLFLSDKYGHEAKGPMHMGTITINDLSEVRRYEFDGAYMSENKAFFTAEINRMDYVEYLHR